MEWLEKLKNDMLEITKTAAYEFFPSIGARTEPYYNLRLEHVKQVEIEAFKLMEAYNDADRDIVLAAVWIHDRFKPQFEGYDHANKAADWVLENLGSKGFPKEKVKAVEYAVRNHAGYEKKPLETLEAQILWDADKIAHRGPSYFFQTVFILTNEGFAKNDPRIKYEQTISIENILPALADRKREIDYDEPNPFHLEESNKLSIEKDEAVNAFLEAMQKRL